MSKLPVVLTNANQSFTDTQKAQGRTNIGAAAAADLQTEISNRSTADTTINNRISTLATNLSTETGCSRTFLTGHRSKLCRLYFQ